MKDLITRLKKFAEERDWDQFHSPKNLAMALGGEVGELMEIFQWKSTDESQKEMLSDKDLEYCKEEMADVFLYLLRLSDKLDIDLVEEAEAKLNKNNEKYPVNLSKGNSTKYSRRNE
tara:strand:- start:76 stop:426 length:351 start_codon:yes stop_codon:yes gene_type:complete